MLERIGQYELLERFATGGMAEVYFARLRGVEGFSRLLAIKKLLPVHSHDQDLVRMFLDEARLAAMLLHPNIVQVLDLGEFDGVYFIAMELIDGPHLGRVLSHCVRSDRHLPIELRVHIVAQAAEGLHYSHSRVDPLSGRSLGIVHRDMSPHNIIVSRYGDVKVADFGIARATIHQQRTEHGVIKGKLGYLAPEQCLGKPIDRRVDVFALGVVLYELLTERRLYHGGRDHDVMRRIIAEEPLPPSMVAPDVDVNLAEIALRALRKEADHRYQTAGELSDALSAWLRSRNAGDLRGQLGYWMTGQTAPIWEPTEARAQRWQQVREDAAPPISDDSEAEQGEPSESLGIRRRLLTDHAEKGTFIGRRAELAELDGLLERGARLITVTGPAGVGKSRLASRLLRRVRDRYLDGGAWIAALGGHDSLHGFFVAVSRQLNVGLVTDHDPPAVQLGRVLKNVGKALLVLDDFDAVVDAARNVVGAWLQAAPELQVVVTSRTRLDIAEEATFEVHPLPVPTESADMASSPAALLFVARARAARSDYRLSPQDAPIVAEIVRRLDGLPLAIELAASRMAVLNAKDLLDRLTRRFDVLQNRGKRGRRPETLRGAIDWSWEALDAREREALARLSVFRSGFTPEAAEAAIGLPDALDLLQSLRSHSLIEQMGGTDGEPMRLGLLHSISDYAAEKSHTRERRETEDRIAAYLVPACERLSAATTRHGGTSSFLQLAAELANLQSLADGLLQRRPATAPAIEYALRAAVACEPVYAARGPVDALLDLLDRGLRAADENEQVQPRLVARAYAVRAESLVALGRVGEGRRDAEQALIRGRKLSDDSIRSPALLALAAAAHRQGRIAEGVDACEHALAAQRRSSDERRAGLTLDRLARLVASSGDIERALDLHDRALSTLRKVGDHRALAWALDHCGQACLAADRIDDSERYFDLALRAMHQISARRGEGVVRGHVALLHLAAGRIDVARQEIRLALDALRGVGDRAREGRVLGLRADRLLLAGRADRAAESARESLQRALESGERDVIARAYLRIAIADADRGEPTAAESALDNARGWTGGHKPPLALAAALANAHILAAFAREAIDAGHLAAAAEHLERATLGIRRAEVELDRAGGAHNPVYLRLARDMWSGCRSHVTGLMTSTSAS